MPASVKGPQADKEMPIFERCLTAFSSPNPHLLQPLTQSRLFLQFIAAPPFWPCLVFIFIYLFFCSGGGFSPFASSVECLKLRMNFDFIFFPLFFFFLLFSKQSYQLALSPSTIPSPLPLRIRLFTNACIRILNVSFQCVPVRLLDICHGPRLEHEQQLVLYMVFEHIDQDLANYLERCPPPGLGADRIKV